MKSILKIIGPAVVAGLTGAACATAPLPGTAQSSAQVFEWNRLALDAVQRSKLTQHQVVRLLAYLSIAQHAAITESPRDADTLASASSKVIAALVPAQAAFVEERHRQLRPSPSAGDRGARIAERVLEQAKADGFGQPWNGTLPGTSDSWRSLATPPAPPAYPGIGTMRTFFLPSGQALRVGPPPTSGNQQFAEDLAEVRQHVAAPTPESTRLARFYDMTTGTMAGGFWNERAVDLMKRGPVGDRQPAAILATLNMAMMDALVACHDSKYHYWVPRPSQVDPSLKALIGVPNHPSYPSNHSCLSTAAAQVLEHFFPAARAELVTTAHDAGVSRIYAGIHYRFDVDAGARLGRAVAAAAVSRQHEALARFTQTTLSQR
jgi:hypothetical protein